LPDAEQSAINTFLQLNIQPPEAPLLQHPPIQPSQEETQHNQEDVPTKSQDQCRSSSRVADKPTAKLHSLVHCQTVLMKKLDILPENKTPTEAHRKRLVGLFSDTMSAQAIAAVEDLLSDGNPAAKAADA
jgi:hypothetical protein